jgi:hypothetical protein
MHDMTTTVGDTGMFRFILLLTTLAISTTSTATTMTSTIIAQESFASFDGSGLSPGGDMSGDPGTLDSLHWQVLGASQGDSYFGDTLQSGDYARGLSSGNVRSGGIYAFSLPANKRGLGFQSTGGDFTPGSLIWMITNPGLQWLDNLSLDFEFWWLNNGPHSSQITTQTRSSGPTWLALPNATVLTPSSSDSLGWQGLELQVDMDSFALAPVQMEFKLNVKPALAGGVRAAGLRVDRKGDTTVRINGTVQAPSIR